MSEYEKGFAAGHMCCQNIASRLREENERLRKEVDDAIGVSNARIERHSFCQEDNERLRVELEAARADLAEMTQVHLGAVAEVLKLRAELAAFDANNKKAENACEIAETNNNVNKKVE